MDSLSAPGVVHQLPRCGHIRPEFLPLLCLADHDVRVATLCHDDDTLVRFFLAITGATESPVSTADVLFAQRPPSRADVVSLPRGLATAPRQSGRLILSCAGFSSGIECHIVGPSADAPTVFWVDGPPLDVLYAIAEANVARPFGIDSHIIDPTGAVVSIPRTCSLRIEDGAWTV